MRLRRDGIRRVWITGLAQDVCVLATVLDACAEGFTVFVVRRATRAVTPDGAKDAEVQMIAAGATFV